MDKIYLNTAACGLVDAANLEVVNKFYTSMQTEASTTTEVFKFGGGYSSMQQAVASFINAPVDNIAFLPNFSFGINTVVQSLKGTEKVLLYKRDFPSLIEPFRINGFDITWIDSVDGFTIDPDELKHTLITQHIELLAISEVQWLSGFRIDIHELGSFCKANNIILIIDATQSLGAVNTDIKKADPDVYIASNYKWMNAGLGTGIMYISDRFINQYIPVIAGFGGYKITETGNFTFQPSAKSYEPGHLNVPGLLLMEAAIQQKLQFGGVQSVQTHNLNLTEQMVNGIAKLPLTLLGAPDMKNRSSIVLMNDVQGLHEHLTNNGILVSKRENYIRISMHFYNTTEHVKQAVECISAFFR